MDNKINIFWLSDIHIREEYRFRKGDNVFSVVLEKFYDYLEKIDCRVDYILLSGDIANYGSKTEYEKFNELILEELLKRFTNAKLLTVPGNHDVDWSIIDTWKSKHSDFYHKFISITKKGVRDVNLRYDFLEKFLSKYSKLFDNYNNSFDAYKSIIPQKNNLYGYHVDEKNKTVFLLLNSSWYSVTSKMVKSIYSDFRDDKIDVDVFFDDVTTLSNDYGKQLIAFSSLDKEFRNDVENILKNYDDYLILTVSHHPENSLDWIERVGGFTKEEINFRTIKEKTSILLSGHEHIPKEHKAEHKDSGKLLHIPGGCFLEHNKYKDGEEKECDYDKWFSVLKINTLRGVLKQEKHFFNSDVQDWNLFREENYRFDKKNFGKVSSNRIKSIHDSKNKVSIFEKDDKEVINLAGYKMKLLGKRLQIEMKSIDVTFKVDHAESLLSEKNLKLIINFIDKNNIEVIDIVFFDFNHNLFDNFKTYEDRLIILQNISRDFDFHFDRFRHDFFNTNQIKQKLKGLNKDKWFNLRILGRVLPFWKLETINLELKK